MPRSDERLSDHVSIGALTRVFPPELVDEVVQGLGRGEVRSRLMPARLTVYFVLALALFRSEGSVDVMRQLVSGLEWESGWKRTWRVPSAAALTLARGRLGEEVLEELFRRVAKPLGASPQVAGRVLVAIDGTHLDLPDTVANEECFGRREVAQGVAAFPQARVMALAECGTEAIFAAKVGALWVGEQTMAPELFGSLDQTMLLLADRGFFSYHLWKKAAATGAELCWRVKANMILPVLQVLPDGTFLSKVYPDGPFRSRDQHGLDVRVVDYRVDGSEQNYRLITTVLDTKTAPAEDLAAAYRARWRIEQSFDELKTHQKGPGLVLRSQSPALVRQEISALLCVHYAIRHLMAGAATASGRDPTDASFTATLRSARRTITTHPGFSPLNP